MVKKRFTLIDIVEPNGQSVADEGIPCTARYCVKELNALHEENEQLKKRIKILEDTIDGLQNTICHFDLEEIIK